MNNNYCSGNKNNTVACVSIDSRCGQEAAPKKQPEKQLFLWRSI
jgi:hypothetical protein